MFFHFNADPHQYTIQISYIHISLFILSFQVIQKFKGQSSVIYDMAIYHPENLLITCGRDKLLKVFDLRTEKIVRSMRGHTNTVSQVVTNPFHKMVSANILLIIV